VETTPKTSPPAPKKIEEKRKQLEVELNELNNTSLIDDDIEDNIDDIMDLDKTSGDTIKEISEEKSYKEDEEKENDAESSDDDGDDADSTSEEKNEEKKKKMK